LTKASQLEFLAASVPAVLWAREERAMAYLNIAALFLEADIFLLILTLN